MKNLNIEVNRPIQQFEVDFLHEILCNPKNAKVLKIYETKESCWNLFLLEFSDKTIAFVSIPKKEGYGNPSIYGSIQHAEQYNTFVDLKID